MGDNLFSVLIATIKSRFAAIVSKLRLWLSWNYVRTRVIGGIRDFFFKLLDVKPKNKNDYFSVFGWMVSKRLAYAGIIIVGVLSIWYIGATTKVFDRLTANGGLRTYSYDSVLLRLAKDKVRIKARSGYVAYEGEVSKGYVTGVGTLYSPDNVMLYNGSFLKNRYEGEGSQYYETGALRYTGSFHDNLYEGEGKLYREDGTEEYEGGFFAGMKDSHGKLVDSGNNAIYEGSFASDEIVYSELLGKSADEIRNMYFGKQVLYEDSEDLGSDSVIHLKDINALYLSQSDGSAADDSGKATQVVVLKDTFRSGMSEADDIEGLRQILGNPIYEGNSSVILPEAIAINVLNDSRKTINGRVDMDVTEVYSDDIVVNRFATDYPVYVYTFKRGSLVYSFVCREKGGDFVFYEIMDGGDTGSGEGKSA
ncbi:MAG: hypothetical protein IJ827_02485 [Lachnospiraceae bacterium]|nr:hypothetical protein [Lachnospiraceae bacterium]